MTKLEKTKTYFKNLAYSLFDTRYLFKFYKYNWITPICILLITIVIMLAPTLIVYSNLSLEDITTKTVHLEDAIQTTLSKGFDCSIKDNKLHCAKEYDYFDYSYTDEKDITTTYRIFVKAKDESGNESDEIILQAEVVQRLITVEDVEAILKAKGADCKIGVQKGTTGQLYCEGDEEWGFAGFKATAVGYKNGSLAVQDLLNGNIDYVIIDSAPAAAITESINEMN